MTWDLLWTLAQWYVGLSVVCAVIFVAWIELDHAAYPATFVTEDRT